MSQLTPGEIGYIVKKAIYLRKLEKMKAEFDRKKQKEKEKDND
jgi:hypothetical protein